jgi:hypothetical protein
MNGIARFLIRQIDVLVSKRNALFALLPTNAPGTNKKNLLCTYGNWHYEYE